MGSTDGGIVKTINQIENAGSATDRWNLVITCDGYSRSQIDNGDFQADADAFKNFFFSIAPFSMLRAAINVYRLDVWSTDPGADDPLACNKGTGTLAATFFDASFCNGGLRHAMWVDTARVRDVVKAAFPALRPTDAVLVLVNSQDYGGRAEDGVAVATLDGAAWNLPIHEVGHLFGLGEEYDGASGCHGPIEPHYRNLTVAATRAALHTAKPEWEAVVSSATAIPTMRTCRKRKKNMPYAQGAVGTFEGGRAKDCCVYRPALACRMRDVNHPSFCPVCEAQITSVLNEFMPHP